MTDMTDQPRADAIAALRQQVYAITEVLDLIAPPALADPAADLRARITAMEASVIDHEHDVADRITPCDLRATWNELRAALAASTTEDDHD